MPVCFVLFEMEKAGIAIDKERLYELEKDFSERVEFAGVKPLNP